VKAIVRRWLQGGLCEGDLDALREIFHPRARIHDRLTPAGSRAAYVRFVRHIHGAIGERTVRIVAEVVAGAQATVVFEFRGQHVGTFLGIVPTGRMVLVSGSVCCRFARGRIVEAWVRWDVVSLLARLGVVTGLQPWITGTARAPKARDRGDLVAGRPQDTLWAKRWKLSPRLARTAVLAMAGLAAKEAAARLGVSAWTIRTYLREIYALAGVCRRTELLLSAAENGKRRHP